MENENESGSDSAKGEKPPPAPSIPESSTPGSQDAATNGGDKPKVSKDQLDRDLVRWTRVLAFFTGALVLAAGLQFWVMHGQLKEMRATRIIGDKAMAAQMAVMQAQTKAMQGQLNQMTLGQRAWIMVSDLSASEIDQFPVGAGIVAFAKYKVTNLGHSPATSISIKTALIFEGLDHFSTKTVQSICAPPDSVENRLFSEHTSTLLPGQSETIDGIGNAARFAHPIDNIAAEDQASWELAQAEERRLGDDDAVPKSPHVNGYLEVYVPPVLIGCVTYKTPGSSLMHETGFALSVQNGISTIPIEVGRKGIVFQGTLDVAASAIGNFAN